MADHVTSPDELTASEARHFISGGDVEHVGGWLHERNGLQFIVAVYDVHYAKSVVDLKPYTTRRYAVAVDGRPGGGGIVGTLRGLDG